MKTLWVPFLAVLLVAWAFAGLSAAQGQTGAAVTTVLATQELDSGIVVEITGFRRKGNTLTVQVRFRNNGAQEREISLDYWHHVYLLDIQGRKQYPVLSADGHAIATDAPQTTSGWRRKVAGGQTALVWMKFPAPPADVKQISLVLDQLLPFDLSVQDD